ncbi:hypothetical protein ACIBL6_47605 [Streptomyces sp. NPDC050400]|uniref:hypothetical protein n=1 Tax=Streptomyces sp. NPDC050400 TaxID=3365610 RepID=UPI0037B1F4AC
MNTSTHEESSPLQQLMALAAEHTQQLHFEQCEAAETAAADHIYRRYPTTLQSLIDTHDWTGHPAVTANQLPPSASAFLGEGLWLVHRTFHDGQVDELRLLVPCSCGDGYDDVLLDGEQDLLDMVSLITQHHARMPHCHPEDCASLPDSRPAAG